MVALTPLLLTDWGLVAQPGSSSWTEVVQEGEMRCEKRSGRMNSRRTTSRTGSITRNSLCARGWEREHHSVARGRPGRT
ncbi:hypothetical protein F4819DRAFT_320919 [Hypoxylon fuscum]|nr:hypothetical protein F4819DRAFT_320919 [Hypoxylon fuscum]